LCAPSDNESGGIGSSKSTNQTSSTTTNTQTTNNNIDNSIHTSDFGAISAAGDIAKKALDNAADLNNSTFAFASRETDASLNFAQGLNDFTLHAITDIAKQDASNYGSIVAQNNTSSDQRVQDIATTALKIGLGMVALITAVIVFGHHKAHA
jgi:glucokinase